MSHVADMVFLFPGQGAQKVGMGKDLHDKSLAARKIFEQADAALGKSLSSMIFNGPEDALKDTAVQQPAIVTVSVAALEALREKLGSPVIPKAAAGLSLGEYSALYSAGAFDFSTCIKLVARRGELMKHASQLKPCGMSVILQMDEKIIEAACAQAAAETSKIISPANFNCEGQVVIAGEISALERAEALLKEKGCKRIMRLPVSGAFHTKLMQPAADDFAKAIHDANINSAKAPVYSNVDSQPSETPEQIRRKLLEQLTHPVLWMRSMKNIIAAHPGRFLELGPGTTLAGMMKRIDATVPVTSLQTFDNVQAFQ
jgi:[acyl-carrier-protein] S-malonyltransferase